MSRNSSSDPSRNKRIIAELMKLPENRHCADCEAKDPRWCSASLGSFICIRCAGIHRNLGVHISFVRSATLDEWADKHVKNMLKWGNDRVNEYYEANVPEDYYIPDENDGVGVVERWIRDKYEHKRFASRELPPPSNQLERLESFQNGEKKKKKKKSSKKEKKKSSSAHKQDNKAGIKPPPSDPSASAPSTQSQAAAVSHQPQAKSTNTSDNFDLLGLFDAVPTEPASPQRDAGTAQFASLTITSKPKDAAPVAKNESNGVDDFDLLASPCTDASSGQSLNGTQPHTAASTAHHFGAFAGPSGGHHAQPVRTHSGMVASSGQQPSPSSFGSAPMGYQPYAAGASFPQQQPYPAAQQAFAPSVDPFA